MKKGMIYTKEPRDLRMAVLRFSDAVRVDESNFCVNVIVNVIFTL